MSGTPPRLKRDEIDFSRLTAQPSDDPPELMSYANEARGPYLPQLACYLTFTTERTGELVRQHEHLAPYLESGFDGKVCVRALATGLLVRALTSSALAQGSWAALLPVARVESASLC